MKCSICGIEQKKVGIGQMFFEGSDEPIGSEFPVYSTNFLTSIKNKDICDNCMDIYNKIWCLFMDVSFSSGGKEYYADGRNLPENT